MMPRKQLLAIAGLLLIVVGLVGIGFFINSNSDEMITQAPKANRHISYSLAIKNKGASILPETRIWIHGPNKRTADQTCLALKTNHPFNLETDQINNQTLLVSFKEFPPYATKIITVNAQLYMHPENSREKFEHEQGYLHEEKLVEISNGEIQKLANQLISGTPEDTAKNILTWVSRNIAKAEYTQQPKGALYALKKRKGDCTEFMHLFIALCRLNNIPARSANGYIITKDAHVSANDLHDWAQVYIKDSWYLADPFYNTFKGSGDRYITMHVQGGGIDAHASFYRWKTDSPQIQIEMLN